MATYDDLKAYLDRLQDEGVDRLVVRWVDESRPIMHGESGVEVAHVQKATFTAKVGGEAEQTEFEGLAYDEMKRIVDTYPFQTLFRSDNVAR
jgi:hypothetical protein